MIVCATRMAFISIPAKHNWPSQNGRLGKYSRFVVAVPKFHWARFMCAPLVWFGLCGTSLATNTIVFRMVFFFIIISSVVFYIRHTPTVEVDCRTGYSYQIPLQMTRLFCCDVVLEIIFPICRTQIAYQKHKRFISAYLYYFPNGQ